MRIARYSVGDQIHYGTVELAADDGPHPDTVADLTGDPMVGPVNLTGARHSLADVRLLAPVIPRSKVVGLAHNYSPERDPDPPAEGTSPELFLKPNTSVIGPGEPIVIPALSADTGLEGEVAVVIGRICRHVPIDRVAEVVFGYTSVNDVTARDFIRPGEPWGIAKGCDNFTPLGPWIVTHLSLEEAENLAITTKVGDVTVQEGTTRRLRWPIGRQIAYISDVMTLLPGDVILTGTPPGACRIEPGQELTVEVEGIGALTNTVVAEDA